MEFKNKEEFIAEVKRRYGEDDICIKLLDTQPDLESILRGCPMECRIKYLESGFTQFAKHCDWSRLNRDDWYYLLGFQPQYAKHCPEHHRRYLIEEAGEMFEKIFEED